MSVMTESLLLEAQSLRLDGDMDAAISTLRTVVTQCNSDINCGTNKKYAVNTTHQIRQMGTYQLAVLLLQRSGRYWYSATNADGASAAKKALLEHSSKDEAEADELLWKLGYRLRLSTKAFGYPSCSCGHDKITSSAGLPFHITDDSMPSVVFDALQFAFRVDSRYWTELYSKVNVDGKSSWRRHVRNKEANSNDQNKNDRELESKQVMRNQFVSHNISLLKYSTAGVGNLIHSLKHAKSLLEQVAIITRHKLAQRFPKMKDATSVEVWCHQRPPDGSHQLHYDMDETRLWAKRKMSLLVSKSDDVPSHFQLRSKRQKTETRARSIDANIERNGVTQQHKKTQEDGIFCPMISCVLTIHVPNNSVACLRCGETSKGAPTIVSNQSILDHYQTRRNPLQASKNGVGWLCHPKPNRLLAFEGSLLHGVVPGIPNPGSFCSHSDSDSDDDAESNSSWNDNVSPNSQFSKRVTLMMGFWGDGVHKHSVNNNSNDRTSFMGPNTPFPNITKGDPSHPWANEFTPVRISETDDKNDVSKVLPYASLEVDPLWKSISRDNDKFGEYVDRRVKGSIQFSGRFFLKSGNTSEIDDEVLAQAKP